MCYNFYKKPRYLFSVNNVEKTVDDKCGGSNSSPEDEPEEDDREEDPIEK
jgi:hypothetical protein